MEKPLYELGPLKAAVLQCNINIAAFQRGVDKELEKKAELVEYIRQHEKYLKWLKDNPENENK